MLRFTVDKSDNFRLDLAKLSIEPIRNYFSHLKKNTHLSLILDEVSTTQQLISYKITTNAEICEDYIFVHFLITNKGLLFMEI